MLPAALAPPAPRSASRTFPVVQGHVRIGTGPSGNRWPARPAQEAPVGSAAAGRRRLRVGSLRAAEARRERIRSLVSGEMSPTGSDRPRCPRGRKAFPAQVPLHRKATPAVQVSNSGAVSAPGPVPPVRGVTQPARQVHKLLGTGAGRYRSAAVPAACAAVDQAAQEVVGGGQSLGFLRGQDAQRGQAFQRLRRNGVRSSRCCRHSGTAAAGGPTPDPAGPRGWPWR